MTKVHLSLALFAVTLFLPRATASEDTCQDSTGYCDIDGTDATCSDLDYGERPSVSNCDNVSCPDEGTCYGATFQDNQYIACDDRYSCGLASFSQCDTVDCTDIQSCESADFEDSPSIVCDNYEACEWANFIRSETVDCSGQYSCQEANFEDTKNIDCGNYYACDGATFSNAEYINCDGNSYACYQSTISNANDVQCTARSACEGAEFSNVNTLECSESSACDSAIISSVPEEGEINCNAYACDGLDISSENAYTLTCDGSSSYSCTSGAIDNPGGTVICYGGSEGDESCQELSIADTVGCLICGKHDSCKSVTIGSMGVTDGKVYIQPTCTEDQFLAYLNKFHPEGGTACENNSGSSDYCDVVEAYCDNHSNDPDCAQEFHYDSEGTWIKGEITCTVSPDGGNCVVNGNDATCSDIDTSSYTVSGCLDIVCTERYSCYGNTFTNSDHVECSGNEACERAIVSSVTSLTCSGGNYACEYATVSDVPEGGSVDCGTAEEAYSYTCRDASITSENAFTLTCAGTPNESFLACAEGHVTNPGGNVFCYGGDSGNGICHDLTISDSIGCVLCASDDACDNVKLVDDNGNEVHSMRNHQVAVYSGCEAADIVDFLNKVHPDGGSVSCQDGESDGYCDVVKKYCDRNPRDANCVDEFQVVDGSWTKERIRSTNDVDPDSLPSGSSHNDESENKVGRESWVVGSVVIVVLLLGMISIVLYCAHKNQWYCWKRVCGGKQHNEQEADSEGNLPHQKAGNSHQQNGSGKENTEDLEDIQLG